MTSNATVFTHLDATEAFTLFRLGGGLLKSLPTLNGCNFKSIKVTNSKFGDLWHGMSLVKDLNVFSFHGNNIMTYMFFTIRIFYEFFKLSCSSFLDYLAFYIAFVYFWVIFSSFLSFYKIQQGGSKMAADRNWWRHLYVIWRHHFILWPQMK